MIGFKGKEFKELNLLIDTLADVLSIDEFETTLWYLTEYVLFKRKELKEIKR